jgi:uncharacterized protein YpmB
MSLRLISFFFILALSILSCTKKEETLSKKWLVEAIEVAGQRLEGDMVDGFYMDLRKDKTYLIVGMNEEAGTWSINESEDSLITINKKGRRAAFFIKKLNSESLTIVDNSVGEATITHFKASI